MILLVFPAKFCIAIVFDFSSNDCNTQEPGEIGNNDDAKLGGGGVNKVHYGLYENGELNLFSSDKLPSQSTAYTPLPCQKNNNNNDIKNGKQSQLSVRNV